MQYQPWYVYILVEYDSWSSYSNQHDKCSFMTIIFKEDTVYMELDQPQNS